MRFDPFSVTIRYSTYGDEMATLTALEDGSRRLADPSDFKDFLRQAPDLDRLELSRDRRLARKVTAFRRWPVRKLRE